MKCETCWNRKFVIFIVSADKIAEWVHVGYGFCAGFNNGFIIKNCNWIPLGFLKIRNDYKDFPLACKIFRKD